jgi:hypothetical protein
MGLSLFLTFSDNWIAHAPEEETQDVTGVFEGHPVKAVASLAVFVSTIETRKHRPASVSSLQGSVEILAGRLCP